MTELIFHKYLVDKLKEEYQYVELVPMYKFKEFLGRKYKVPSVIQTRFIDEMVQNNLIHIENKQNIRLLP